MARPVQVRITGDSTSAVRAIDSTEAQLRDLNRTAQHTDSVLGGLKRGLLGVGSAILAGNALGSGISLIKESVGLASDLAETQSKVGTVFGKSAKGITEWAKTTDAAMAMSQRAILDTVTGFDLLLTNRGLGAGAARKMSQELTTLAADLSSFFNTSTQEAADALSSALRGEMDPIERFGVSLDDATLKARAYAMGLYSGKGALSATAKAQAAYAEILDQTKKAQGDLGRTQGSAANQMRQFKTNIEALKTTAGTVFTPLIEEYLPGINKWLRDINNEDAAGRLGQKLLDFAKVIETQVFPKVKDLGRTIKDAFSGVDGDSLSGAGTALAGAAENIAGAVGSLFRAFDGLSPQAKENLVTIAAAAAALSVLTKTNPVIKIGVGLAADVIGTVATSVIERVVRGTMPVKVTNWPKVYPDGDTGDGDGSRKGKRDGGAAVVVPDRDRDPDKSRGRQVAAGVGKAGLAALAASLIPSIIGTLPLSQGFKDAVASLANVAVVTALAPGGAVVKGLTATLMLAWEFGRPGTAVKNLSSYVTGPQGLPGVKSDLNALEGGVKNLSSYVTGPQGIPGVKKDVQHVESDLEREKGSRRKGDESNARATEHVESDLEREKGSRRTGDARNAGDINTEAGRRRRGDAHLQDQIDTAEERLNRIRLRRVEAIVGAPISPPPLAAGRSVPAVTNNYYTFNVNGSGAPQATVREIERYLRRAGDPSRVSVTGAPA